MTKKQYLDFHKKCCELMVDITAKKNADYSGSGDDPFSNFRQIGALIQKESIVEIGFLTRMSDKLSRVGSFISNGELKVKDESIKDTLLDLANYCILFAGYLEELKLNSMKQKILHRGLVETRSGVSTGGIGGATMGGALIPGGGAGDDVVPAILARDDIL